MRIEKPDCRTGRSAPTQFTQPASLAAITYEITMADISITQQHNLSLQQSKEAAQQVADRMAAEYEMTTQWDGDVLTFGRSGIEGKLALGEQQVQVDITLEGFFKTFAPMIEDKITRNIAKTFGATA
jgi:putative polyhydroxyalkanoate system protein